MPPKSKKFKKMSSKNTANVHKKYERLEMDGIFAYHGNKSDLRIWLDVDGTLLDGGLILGKVVVFPRTHLKEFLRFCKKMSAHVGLITNADYYYTRLKFNKAKLPYISHVVDRSQILEIREIEGKGYMYESGVARIKVVPDFDASNTLIIDDYSEYYPSNHRQNVLEITYFDGDKPDSALALVAQLLKNMAYNVNRDIPAMIDELTAAHPNLFKAKSNRTFEYEWNK